MDSRYVDIISVFGEDSKEKIRNSKILVVGAGGIGCELLKTLVLVGFENLTVIDLDTIDVSNLNRQFLFRKEHVGKSKAVIAGKKAMEFNRNARVDSRHGNVFDDEFGPSFYSQFNVVINGLDNIQARKQVNRMCIAASVPMIDGGTRGYDGQVLTTHKGVSECYECLPKMLPKTFAVCTIRQHPSEPIHCVVWAKHCYNEFFGVVPEMEVTTSQEGEEKPEALIGKLMEIKDSKEFSVKAFEKFFVFDIKQLLEMKDHSTFKRGVPTPIELSKYYSRGDDLDVGIEKLEMESTSTTIVEQREWSVAETCLRFLRTLQELRDRFDKDKKVRPFDKDDALAMEFVATATNLRATIFHISKNSLFEIKSIAGNIIPAIASSNAIISGLEVMEAIKIVTGNAKLGRDSYLKKNPSRFRRKSAYIVPLKFQKPNADCFVCSSSELKVQLNCQRLKMRTFIDRILKPELGMKDPCVVFESRLIWDSEDSDPEVLTRVLSSFGVKNESFLVLDDMAVEEMHWKMAIIHDEEFAESEFKVLSKNQAPVKSKKKVEEEEKEKIQMSGGKEQIVIDDDSDDDDVILLDDSDDGDVEMKDKDVVVDNVDRKRKRDEDAVVVLDDDESELKKRKIETSKK